MISFSRHFWPVANFRPKFGTQLTQDFLSQSSYGHFRLKDEEVLQTDVEQALERSECVNRPRRVASRATLFDAVVDGSAVSRKFTRLVLSESPGNAPARIPRLGYDARLSHRSPLGSPNTRGAAHRRDITRHGVRSHSGRGGARDVRSAILRVLRRRGNVLTR